MSTNPPQKPVLLLSPSSSAGFTIWKPGYYCKGCVVFHGDAYYSAETDTRDMPPSGAWAELKPRLSPFRFIPMPLVQPRSWV